MEATKSTSAHILVFPFPSQGHMLPMLDLAAALSAAGLAVTVLVTPKNLHLLSPLLSRCPSIQPLVLPFPATTLIPAGIENLKDLHPSYFAATLHVLAALYHPLLAWARANTINPLDAIISDLFLGWTHRLAADLGIPRLVFSSSGAYAVAVIVFSLWRRMPRRPDEEDDHFPVDFPELPNSPTFEWYELSMLYRSYRAGDMVSETMRAGFLGNTESWGFVFNSFDELEVTYLEYIKRELGSGRVWAVGPLSSVGAIPATVRGGASSVPEAKMMTWLDRCPDGSVVFVCFGSQAVLTPAQGAAVAAGLERSGARFVWCVRIPLAAEAGEGGEVVPEGFEETVKERGMVIKGWAPQVAILSHAAVGTFLTHCGWNSALEGIMAGVTLLTWPMSADQFQNARLLEEEAGVAARVCQGYDAVPDSGELGRVIAKSVLRGWPLRAKASELKKKAMKAVTEGGSSFSDMEGLVEVLSSLRYPKVE